MVKVKKTKKQQQSFSSVVCVSFPHLSESHEALGDLISGLVRLYLGPALAELITQSFSFLFSFLLDTVLLHSIGLKLIDFYKI